MNLIVNAFLSSALNFATCIFTWVKRCLRKHSVKHQALLLELFTNPVFDISSRFASMLMTIFCTLMYCGGLPIVTSFGAIFCFVTYWTDKLVLLRGSRRPPAYDIQMPKQAANFLLFAGPLHLFVTITMYSHQCTFPSLNVGGAVGGLSEDAMSASGQNSSASNNAYYERGTKESTWMLTVILGVLLTVISIWIVLSIVGATFGEAVKFLAVICCPKRNKVVPEGEAGQLNHLTWTKAYPRLKNVQPPASYRMENHPDFKMLANYLNADTEVRSQPVSPAGGESGGASSSLRDAGASQQLGALPDPAELAAASASPSAMSAETVPEGEAKDRNDAETDVQPPSSVAPSAEEE